MSDEKTQLEAEAKLRHILLHRRLHGEIANVIATWPCETLCLKRCVSHQMCLNTFGNLEVLWTHFIKAFAIMSEACCLKCLDFCDFTGDENLLFTVLILLPLGVLGEQGRVAENLLQLIVHKYDVSSQLILRLRAFLEGLVSHRVFKIKQQFYVPKHGFDIILYGVQLASDKVNFLAYLVASSVEQLTNIRVSIRSFQFTYPTNQYHKLDEVDAIAPLKCLGLYQSESISELELINLTSENLIATLNAISEEGNFRQVDSLSILSCDANLSINSNLRLVLMKAIRHLSSLTKLKLPGINLSGQLTDIISHLHKPLVHLSLQWCCLDKDDITGLVDSRHAAILEDLDLSFIHLPYKNYKTDCHHSCLLVTDESRDETNVAVMTIKAAVDINMNNFQNDIIELKDNLNFSQDSISDQLLKFVQQLHIFQNLRILQLGNRINSSKSKRVIITSLQKNMCKLPQLEELNLSGFALLQDDIEAMIRCTLNNKRIKSLKVTLSPYIQLPTYIEKGKFWSSLHAAKNGKNIKIIIENFPSHEFPDKRNKTIHGCDKDLVSQQSNNKFVDNEDDDEDFGNTLM